MVTSPNEWKILEWDEKQQTNKQTTCENYVLMLLFMMGIYDIDGEFVDFFFSVSC